MSFYCIHEALQLESHHLCYAQTSHSFQAVSTKPYCRPPFPSTALLAVCNAAMAGRNVKRKRALVSYRELSTDDSSSDDSRGDVDVVKNIVVPQRRSNRASNRSSNRASNRASHRASNRGSSRPQASSRSRQNRIVSYKEPSSDEDMDEDFKEEEGSPPQRAKREKMTPSASQTRAPRRPQRGRPARSGRFGGPVKCKAHATYAISMRSANCYINSRIREIFSETKVTIHRQRWSYTSMGFFAIPCLTSNLRIRIPPSSR